jgi:hypothetical protein
LVTGALLGAIERVPGRLHVDDPRERDFVEPPLLFNELSSNRDFLLVDTTTGSSSPSGLRARLKLCPGGFSRLPGIGNLLPTFFVDKGFLYNSQSVNKINSIIAAIKTHNPTLHVTAIQKLYQSLKHRPHGK